MHVTLTVDEVLKTNGFRRSKVLAGMQGLNRIVTKITVAELSDTLDWLQGGELVCTTAFCLQNNPEDQENWIVGMAKKNIAALAIKTERFFGQIPQDMLKLADTHDFPLIELPLDVTWPVVIQGVMNMMLDVQTKRLKDSLNVHNQLTNLVLTSTGLQTIMNTIAELAKNPVILEDRFFNLIVKGGPDNTYNNTIVATRLSANTKNSYKNNLRFIETIKTKHKTFLREPLILEKGTLPQLIIPIFAGNTFFGWLSILLVNELEELYLRMIMEHGSTVLALELLKEKVSLEAQTKAKSDFLRILLENDSVSDEELLSKSKLLGIDLTLPTCIYIVSVKPDISMTLSQTIESFIIANNPQATVIQMTDSIVVFHHIDNCIDQENAIDEIIKAVVSLGKLLENYEYSYAIGIGRCYVGHRLIKKSYFEAEQALAKSLKSNQKINSFFDLGIERLLYMPINRADIHAFVQDYLSKLIDYDKKHNAELTYTLKCYILNNFNQAETSRQLHLHINSLNYRLQRIQNILNRDISNFETCHMLFLALNFYDFIFQK